MSLETGTRLGAYEIVAPLGAGGMGEVFRARDTRIGREVAIKVLPASVAEDRDRLARFQREAQTAGSLNHPNLLTIHEFGAGEGGHQMVPALLRNPESAYVPVAIVDDDPRKQHLRIRGVPVRGTRADIPRLAKETNASTMLIPKSSSATCTKPPAVANKAASSWRGSHPRSSTFDGSRARSSGSRGPTPTIVRR